VFDEIRVGDSVVFSREPGAEKFRVGIVYENEVELRDSSNIRYLVPARVLLKDLPVPRPGQLWKSVDGLLLLVTRVTDSAVEYVDTETDTGHLDLEEFYRYVEELKWSPDA
jgi:hypothetical protein